MPFNGDIHHRRSIRLQDYDYTHAGAYFVTICAFRKECLFGEVVDGLVRLNETGLVMAECWRAIPGHFPHVVLDEFVIMPNHVHGIILLNDVGDVGATHASPLTAVPAPEDRATHRVAPTPGPASGSVGSIIGQFKSAVTRRVNQIRTHSGAPIWQRNYYEHIIRNEEDLDQIRCYINANPPRWEEDENHPSRQSGSG